MPAPRRPDPAGPASRPRLARRPLPIRACGSLDPGVGPRKKGSFVLCRADTAARQPVNGRPEPSWPGPSRQEKVMFITSTSQGTRPRMTARNARPRRRLAGVLVGLPAALLASSVITPAAFASPAPAGVSAFLSGSADDIAFQANTKLLWTTSGPGTGQSLGLGMKTGTSPAIAALPGGGYEAAFQANTGHLWVVQNGVGQDLGLGMKAGTSPAIAALPGGGYEAAFQANTGHLWVVRNGVGQDLGLGMKAGTSPAIAALPRGGYEAAFQANTGHLWVVRNGVGQDLGLGMKAGTSPAIAALPRGGYEAAFQANT